MKRILLLCIVLLPLMADAQSRQGRPNNNNNNGGGRGGNGGGRGEITGEAGSALTVFSFSGERFSLLLNGVKQNLYPQSRIRVEDMPYVVNDIQIIFDDNVTPAISRRVSFLDPVDGNAINLTLKLVRERGAYPRLMFHKSTPLERDYRGEQGEYIMHYGRDVSQPRQVIVNTPPPPPAGPMPMDMNSFMEAKRAISASNWDDTRLSTAQTIANNNFFTVDQVIEICKLFSWDDAKMKFAKFVYKRTLDQNNFYKVGSVFSWDTDKQKLNDFINSQR